MSGSMRANMSGRSVCSGGRYASEIFGGRPSSRRRLAQKAALMTASTASASGVGASPSLPAARAASARRVKWPTTPSATLRAAG